MRIPLPSRFTVVSKPAASTRPAVARSSASLSRVPSSLAAMSWLIRSSPGASRSRWMWSASHVVEPVEAAFDAQVLLPRQADVEAGRGELAELEDAGPFVVGHPDDVADDGDRQLRAVAVDDVDGASPPPCPSIRAAAACCTRSRSAATALVVNTDDTVLR